MGPKNPIPRANSVHIANGACYCLQAESLPVQVSFFVRLISYRLPVCDGFRIAFLYSGFPRQERFRPWYARRWIFPSGRASGLTGCLLPKQPLLKMDFTIRLRMDTKSYTCCPDIYSFSNPPSRKPDARSVAELFPICSTRLWCIH